MAEIFSLDYQPKPNEFDLEILNYKFRFDKRIITIVQAIFLPRLMALIIYFSSDSQFKEHTAEFLTFLFLVTIALDLIVCPRFLIAYTNMELKQRINTLITPKMKTPDAIRQKIYTKFIYYLPGIQSGKSTKNLFDLNGVFVDPKEFEEYLIASPESESSGFSF